MPEPVRANPRLRGLRCLGCARDYPIGDYPVGCPQCAEADVPANLFCTYDEAPSGRVRLPFTDRVTLGEGETPVLADVEAARLGELDLRVKLEGANPTGSHKDRFAAFAVSRAVLAGYHRVAAASSGNAAVALAAYAGRAGLGATMVVTDEVPERVRALLTDLGADVVVTTYERRWPYLAELAAQENVLAVTNHHLPAVGSHPFGIEGYKPIAEELLAAFDGAAPDWVVMPSSRGDVAWGIHLGFTELVPEALPRLCLVEPFPRVRAALEHDADPGARFPGSTDVLPSIAGNTTTHQAVRACRDSGGCAVTVTDAEAIAWNRRMWTAGLCLEASSNAALLGAAGLLESGRARPGQRVAVVATAHGLKGM